MSSHHKAPLAAFVVVALACLVVLVQAVRGDAISLLRRAPSALTAISGEYLHRLPDAGATRPASRPAARIVRTASAKPSAGHRSPSVRPAVAITPARDHSAIRAAYVVAPHHAAAAVAHAHPASASPAPSPAPAPAPAPASATPPHVSLPDLPFAAIHAATSLLTGDDHASARSAAAHDRGHDGGHARDHARNHDEGDDTSSPGQSSPGHRPNAERDHGRGNGRGSSYESRRSSAPAEHARAAGPSSHGRHEGHGHH